MSSIIETAEISLPASNYKYITTDEEAKNILNESEQFKVIAVDTETTSLDPFVAKVSLVQVGTPRGNYVFDVRSDTNFSSIDINTLKPFLVGNKYLRILQNVVYDMKVMKTNFGFYIENIYDTMLAEQILNLGLNTKASLLALVLKYLGMHMDKEPAHTFEDYYQKFQPFQLEYAAKDVMPLPLIRDLQIEQIKKHGLEDVCRLEFEFTKALCEMELNGVLLNVDKWRAIMSDTMEEKYKIEKELNQMLSPAIDQMTLFGISLVDINSPMQLKKALNKLGIKVENTDEKALSKHSGKPVVDKILEYRKAAKLISTYAEPIIDRIHPRTGRLHTSFKQMVSTGRLSSSDPNLQNIPKDQKYRSCFIAKDGYKLITADMSSAELRILANLSLDPIFLDCYEKGIDLHSRTGAEINDMTLDSFLKLESDKQKKIRNAAKSINFGLAYGLTKYGLSRRLEISEDAADEMINKYFNRYHGIKTYLDKAAKDAIMNRYSTTVSGRKRFYTLPEYGHPDFKKIKGSIERQAKNAGIQGCVTADTIISGLGAIANYVNKTVEIETGFGKDTAVVVYSGYKEVYDLLLSNGTTIGITLDHKLPVMNEDGKIIDVAVKHLVPEHKLLTENYCKGKFCTIKGLIYRAKEDTYDLICNNIHYFIANGIVVHNSNADTIKQAMIYLVDRLEESGYDAKLVLTVHDELVVETREDQAAPVRELLEKSIIDGFGRYFNTIPMETEALAGPCWLKGKCEAPYEGGKCNGTSFEEVLTNDKYKSKIVCSKCKGAI